jgi:hypothetical protein
VGQNRAARAQNRMTRDVLAHLRAISAQQSKIRGLRNKLAILREAAGRHADALGEFRAVRAAAAAYSQCLAECLRRCALAPRWAPRALINGLHWRRCDVPRVSGSDRARWQGGRQRASQPL